MNTRTEPKLSEATIGWIAILSYMAICVILYQLT